MKNSIYEEQVNFVSAKGTTGKIVAARLFGGVDILLAIEQLCEKHSIECGFISVCIGSLRKVSFKYTARLVPTEKEGYVSNVEIQGPFQLLGGQGIITPSEERGKREIHLHLIFSGNMVNVHGGHIKEGTLTLTTTDLVITETKGIRSVREKDPETGIIFTRFEEETPDNQ